MYNSIFYFLSVPPIFLSIFTILAVSIIYIRFYPEHIVESDSNKGDFVLLGFKSTKFSKILSLFILILIDNFQKLSLQSIVKLLLSSVLFRLFIILMTVFLTYLLNLWKIEYLDSCTIILWSVFFYIIYTIWTNYHSSIKKGINYCVKLIINLAIIIAFWYLLIKWLEWSQWLEPGSPLDHTLNKILIVYPMSMDIFEGSNDYFRDKYNPYLYSFKIKFDLKHYALSINEFDLDLFDEFIDWDFVENNNNNSGPPGGGPGGPQFPGDVVNTDLDQDDIGIVNPGNSLTREEANTTSSDKETSYSVMKFFKSENLGIKKGLSEILRNFYVKKGSGLQNMYISHTPIHCIKIPDNHKFNLIEAGPVSKAIFERHYGGYVLKHYATYDVNHKFVQYTVFYTQKGKYFLAFKGTGPLKNFNLEFKYKNPRDFNFYSNSQNNGANVVPQTTSLSNAMVPFLPTAVNENSNSSTSLIPFNNNLYNTGQDLNNFNFPSMQINQNYGQSSNNTFPTERRVQEFNWPTNFWIYPELTGQGLNNFNLPSMQINQNYVQSSNNTFPTDLRVQESNGLNNLGLSPVLTGQALIPQTLMTPFNPNVGSLVENPNQGSISITIPEGYQTNLSIDLNYLKNCFNLYNPENTSVYKTTSLTYLPYYKGVWHQDPVKVYNYDGSSYWFLRIEPANPVPNLDDLFINNYNNRFIKYKPGYHLHKSKLLLIKCTRSGHPDCYISSNLTTPSESHMQILNYERM